MTGKALDNYENSSPEITYVWDDVASRDQRWEICQTDSQYCYIKNIETGRALTATENENGSSITATNYEGLDIQKWKIVDCGKAELSASVIEPGHNYKIINRYTGDVLDNWNLENGSICYSYIWTGVNNQKWKVSVLNDEGVYIIENQRSGRVLDCYGAENNSDVYIWDNESASDQHWKIESLNNGYFKIVNCKSNLALTQSIQGNGNAIFGFNYVGAEQQQWEFVLVN